MEALFLKLVNMSITASWLVLAIIAVRFIFKKAPKWILCLLWGLVAVRLICPFSIESSLSLIPDAEPLSQQTSYSSETVKQANGDILDSEGNIILEQHPAANGDILDSEGNVIVVVRDGIRTYPDEEKAHGWMYFLSGIWLVGFGLMLSYTVVSYYLLKKKVSTAIPLKRGIKQCEYVDSPFVLGMIRPVIYLPFGMEEGDMAYVIAHEKAHIRRRDHWWKPFGFLLLSVYWFNPVLWVAYILLCRDIEAACDEKVIKDMEKDERRAYSTALLNCSIHRRRIAACPLAFGETGVKARVKSVMYYKKPAFWVILIALVITIIVAVCFLTNPKEVLPLTVDVDYIGRNWADLKFILDDSYAEGEIQISDNYILEVQEQGMWREVENLSDKQPAQQVIGVQSDSADYDAWTSINWEEHYGRLPDGTFRLRKDITIHKDSDDSETQPIYVEFTIGGTADEYVTYTLENITSTGAKLYEHEKVTDEFHLIYDGSGGIWLESYQDEQWTYVEPTEYIEPILKKERHYINQLIYASEYIQLDWSSLYGELPDGNYRIAREVTNTAEGDLRVCTAYVEFTIDTNWGIELLVDKISENGLSVGILIGDDVADGEYFHVGTTLQHKEGIGHWTDIIPITEEMHSQDEPLSDMSAVPLIWDSELHKMVEGQYRVGIRIQPVHPSGEKEVSMLYEYFDLAEYAWGASIEVTEITQDNGPRLTVVHNGSKKLPEGCLTMSHDFRLEKRSDNQWKDMGTPLEDIPDTEHPIAYGNNYETEYIGITHYFGELPDGTYRLVKDVTRYYDDGSTETRPIYAVFSMDKNYEKNSYEWDNVYTWFDLYSTDVNEQSPKDTLVDLFGMKNVTLSYNAADNTIYQIDAEGRKPIITCDVIFRNVFLTDLTGDGISEVCATVQNGSTTEVQVYDASEQKFYELPVEGSGYKLTKKADRLCIYWNDSDFGNPVGYWQLALEPGKGIVLADLDPEVEALKSRLVCVDVNTRKRTCLSSTQQLNQVMTLLRSLQGTVKPATADELAAAEKNGIETTWVTVNYELGQKNLFFSENYDLVWEPGSSEAFRIPDPEPIRQFLESVTDGVRNKETSGAAFATVDAPWDWCAGVNVDAISDAEIYACLDKTSNDSGYSVSSTNGVLPAENLRQLIGVLNQVPKEAFSDSGRAEKTFRWFAHEQTEGSASISVIDGVNQLAVAIRIREGYLEMIMTEELDKAQDMTSAYLEPAAKIWTIRDPALRDFMKKIAENPPAINYAVGAEYDWQGPVEFNKGKFNLKLYLIEDWIYEEVKNSTNSGIRCRPKDVEDGWLYFSFWPGRYSAEEEDLHYEERTWNSFPTRIAYPAAILEKQDFVTRDDIWLFETVNTDVGDFAIINDGADDWFANYVDQIHDTTTLLQFTTE